MLPTITPILATLAIWTFLTTWNDFMWPLIVLSDERRYTLPVALASLVGEHVQDTELMMAGSVLTVLPVRDRLSRAAALLHPGRDGREREGVSRRPHTLLGFWARSCLWRARARKQWRPPLPSSARLLDGFETTAGWSAHPSDGVSLAISADSSGTHGHAMRLDFDFHGHGGYAIARKKFDIALPENYALSYRIRGDAPPENFEVKLIDSTGDNVWWNNAVNVHFPRSGRTVTLKKRHITFAWGPRGGGELGTLATLELSITAGSGGKGTVWIDALTFTPLDAHSPVHRNAGRERDVRSGRPCARARVRRQGIDVVEERDIIKRTDLLARLRHDARVRWCDDRLGARCSCARLCRRDLGRRREVGLGVRGGRRKWWSRLDLPAGGGVALPARTNSGFERAARIRDSRACGYPRRLVGIAQRLLRAHRCECATGKLSETILVLSNRTGRSSVWMATMRRH